MNNFKTASLKLMNQGEPTLIHSDSERFRFKIIHSALPGEGYSLPVLYENPLLISICGGLNNFLKKLVIADPGCPRGHRKVGGRGYFGGDDSRRGVDVQHKYISAFVTPHVDPAPVTNLKGMPCFSRNIFDHFLGMSHPRLPGRPDDGFPTVLQKSI